MTDHMLVMNILVFVMCASLLVLFFVQRKQISDSRNYIGKLQVDLNTFRQDYYLFIVEVGGILDKLMDKSLKDKQRLENLKEILRRKVATHTNPVEIGIADLTWLLELAKKAIEEEARND